MSVEEKYEMVPGTVHLVDVQGIFDAKKNGDIILIPQPSSNINDPLRWSQKKKWFQFGLAIIWATVLAATINFSGPLFALWTVEWNCTFTELNNGVAISYLCIGFGCVFLQPLGIKVGKRIVFAICSILYIISCIICGVAKDIKPYYAFNALAGWGGAPTDSLISIASTDVFFMHERSRIFAAVMFAISIGTNMGPVICGLVVDSIGWRWCFWICLILVSTVFVLQLFLQEDTAYNVEFDGDRQEEQILETIKSYHSMASPNVISSEIAEAEKNGTLKVLVCPEEDDSSIDWSIPKRTYWQKMKLIETEYTDPRPYTVILLRPFLLWRFPAVMWAGIVTGMQSAWQSLLITTQSEIYSAPPYNFNTAAVGLTNIAPCVGGIFGMLWGGLLVDWFSVFMARRNNGIMEPEFRLWTLILPTITNATALVAYGIGSAKGINWVYPTVFGQAFLGFAGAAINVTLTTYAVDCYSKLASESLVITHLISNIMAMVFTYVFQPWIIRCGFIETTWLLFMLSIIFNGSFICFIMYGKRMRKWTADKYEIYTDKNYGLMFDVFGKKYVPKATNMNESSSSQS